MKKQFALLVLFIICTSSSTSDYNEFSIRPNKDYALFFAVEDYDEWQDLENPISDATKIAQELESNYDFETEVIKNPTRKAIYLKLQEYRERTYATDAQLLIFFTGHGEFAEDSKEGFFVPREGRLNDPFHNSLIPHSRLDPKINLIPCNHILVAIDACFSGTFDEALARNKSDDRPGANENQRGNFIERTLQYKSRLYITSGGIERTPDKSQFAQQFLAALRGFGGEDKIVSFSELVTFLLSANPTPQSGQFTGNDIGSNFLFILNNEDNAFPNNEDNTSENEDIVSPVLTREDDLNAWENAERGNSLLVYQEYLQKFPNGIFASKARESIKELEDETEWLIAEALNASDAYHDYLAKHPNGKYASDARQKIKYYEERTDWKSAETLNTSVAYHDYLTKYPNGKYVSRAEKMIQELEQEMDWKRAEALNTSVAYHDYLAKYPSGKNADLAKKRRFSGSNGIFIDSRDERTYTWVKMKDGKLWMAENLNYNGSTSSKYASKSKTASKTAKTKSSRSTSKADYKAASKAKASEITCYNNDESFCNEYGRLYTWEAAKTACPEGWHLPSDREWNKMISYYGSVYRIHIRGRGGNTGTEAYNNLIKGGESGLGVMFGGARYKDRKFYDLKNIGYYWSATANNSNLIWDYSFDKSKRSAIRKKHDKTNAFSCRCVKN